MRDSAILEAMEDELVKISSFGLNVGRSWGRSSSSAGFSTKFRSAGTANPIPRPRAVPKLPGSNLKGMKAQPLPKPVGEANNQRGLRRGLSNIELPKPR